MNADSRHGNSSHRNDYVLQWLSAAWLVTAEGKSIIIFMSHHTLVDQEDWSNVFIMSSLLVCPRGNHLLMALDNPAHDKLNHKQQWLLLD